MDDDVANLPIDIHVTKLVDWLVSRQHASKNWPESLRTIREKINEAIQDMPEHPGVTKLLSGTYINYFHCLKIIDILKETEADSKNILGWYTSQRMKDWQNVVKLYEKGGTSLAEGGQLLHRYVIHEIPGIKAQINRYKQVQVECDKREEAIHKSAANAVKVYKRHVKQIGISGDDVRDELFALVEGLPADIDQISHLFKNLENGMKFYLEFIGFTSDGRFTDSLQMLRYMIDHGNVTTYEYTHKVAPQSVEDPFADLKKINAEAKLKKAAVVSDTIDFGDDAEGSIDFGDCEVVDGNIDFGIELDDENIQLDDGGIQVNDGGIDFGDDVILDAGVISLDGTGGEAETSDGVAEGQMALTLLHNSNTRAAILDDVYELEGFLQQRLFELNSTDESKMTLNLFDDAPKSLQMITSEQISAMIVKANAPVTELTSTKMQQLFLISDSHKYVERLSDTLDLEKRRCTVSPGAFDALNERRLTSAQQVAILDGQLTKIQAATLALAKELQRAVSAKYKGRPVNIMGVVQKN